MTMAEKLAIHQEIVNEDKALRQKYYEYSYSSEKHGGTGWFLAASEQEARKRLRKRLHDRYPFCKFIIQLKNVSPV